MMGNNEWHQLLEYIFGGVEKKYNNLGIWVEQDEFFNNFYRLQLGGEQKAGNEIEFDKQKL